ncbi:CRAL/TRIO domain [Popillia japonica]|uniref:CRAL/TRIO domain n=1 Tax=Popillia japonica TaxID=7064 RepID=A0AAW1HVT3_POPJA
MSEPTLIPVNEADLKDLKGRMKLISEADPSQYHNEFSLKRYLRAFKTPDDAFKAILKTNKWRKEYGVDELGPEVGIIKKNLEAKKARVLKHRDLHGRPFIVYCLEDASKRCFEEVIDNLCIVFDLRDFGLNCMDYQVLKNLIWLLSKHYPERLGVCLIINAPTLFAGCWSIIKGWLDENTASKVLFVNSEEDLCTHLIPDILPDDV